MEDIEFLKAMLAEMNANMKSNQADANRIADRKERKADQDDLKRIMEEINAKMDSNQAEIRSTVCAIRSELNETNMK
jgi:uncharacterized FlaG/YvyC family protein